MLTRIKSELHFIDLEAIMERRRHLSNIQKLRRYENGAATKKFLDAYHAGERVFCADEYPKVSLVNQELPDIVIAGDNLQWVSFHNCNLNSSKFILAHLGWVNIVDCDLSNSTILSDSIHCVQFTNCTLTGATIMSKEIERIKFYNTNTSDANLNKSIPKLPTYY